MATERIVNGGFDSGTSNWNFSGNVLVAGSNSSDSATFSSSNTPITGEISQTFAVTGDQTATLSFDYGKVGTGSGEVSGTWSVYDATTNTLLETGSFSDSSGYSSAGGADTTDNNITTAIDIPAGVTSLKLVFTDTSPGTHNKDLDIDDVSFVTCFCQGTLIATPTGPVAVEDFQTGDLAVTLEGDSQPLVRLLSTRISNAQLQKNPKLRPVRIKRGAFGAGLPARDLLVSRQHRMLVSSEIVKRMFGIDAVLIPAIKLTMLPNVYVDDDVEDVTYYHLLFDRHEAVIAEGVPSESFYTGPEALKALPSEAQDEVMTLFPELVCQDYSPIPAYPLLSNAMQKKLVARHVKNNMPVACELVACT